MKNLRHARHDNVPPLIDKDCRVLLLGSMLSPKSAEAAFYYAHPQNRFWRVLAEVFDCPPAEDRESRARLALSHKIALWDVISECTIEGAADDTITDVVYNDVAGLLARYPNIRKIYTTGGKAHELLKRYAKTVSSPLVSEAERLPSTSPLNCAIKLPALATAYSVIKQYI